jgi:glycosyltransferase involved in cell wall biosynthesis
LKTWRRTGLLLTLHDYSLICAKKRLMYRGSPCSGPGFTKCLACAADHYGPAKGVATALSNWAMQPLERAAVDLFLPVSRAVAIGNRLEERRLPYRLIPNFVPDDVAVPKGDATSFVAQLPPDSYLMFAGDLAYDKGVGVLLQAYTQLSCPPPLVLIGRPSSGAPTHIPPNVTVLHSWPHHAVIEAWRRSLVALVPSIWPDPCPTVVMEAMASGRPVIGSRIGGISDLILDGETGLLVPPGDATALRQALERILSDAALRARLGQGALRRVVAFQEGAVVPQIEQAYRDVLRRRIVPPQEARPSRILHGAE